MISYVVSVAGPEPAWIRWNPDTNLPCVTFDQPDGISLSEAEALKACADICCGGTLSVVPVASARVWPGLKAAFEAMAAGDSLLAQDMFEREVAKNVAQLALIRGDLSKAVRYFELALAAVPGDLETALQLGYAWIAQGSLQKAGDTFGGVIARARELQEERYEAWGHNGQGDVRMSQGDGSGALAAYEAAMGIREGLAQRDLAN